MGNAYEFDKIAQEVFFPIYAVIAEDIKKATGKIEGHLLDLGCGGGHLGLSVLKATRMTAALVDRNPDAAAIAEKRAYEWGLAARTKVIVGDVQELPLKDASIDLAVSRGSVGFWEDEGKAFSEIYRVLAPGGMTYIGCGFGSNELKTVIFKKMKALNPGWPENLKGITNGYEAGDYDKLLSRLGYKHEIIDDDAKGMWIIVRKQ